MPTERPKEINDRAQLCHSLRALLWGTRSRCFGSGKQVGSGHWQQLPSRAWQVGIAYAARCLLLASVIASLAVPLHYSTVTSNQRLILNQ